MPKRTDINSVLILGAGPIVIGQACEFDYSGVQACKAMREEGCRVILVNSNPATIMTDPEMADATYIEPVHWEIVARIIEKEKPDALLPTMGGQTALNCALDLCREGILERYNVKLIGATREAIDKAEDRDQFRQAMKKIGLEMPRSAIAHSLEEALQVQTQFGFPVIIRPSFTLGGEGGGIAYNREEFVEICENGLELSPTNELLIDESVLGWKEYEMEVVRDSHDNCIIVCSIENLDPMGVHTGDSITVAPAQTLTDKEYQQMRDASFAVLREIGVDTGGSNVQFALNPQNGQMLVIEMNPRVSRSSALASKATGFPIAKVAAKLALGYTLNELENEIIGQGMPISFEPTIDYVVTKIPRFDFEKFSKNNDRLSTQMKSVGESMAMGSTFQESLQKAIRSLETGRHGLEVMIDLTDNEQRSAMRRELHTPGPHRLWYVADAFRSGLTLEDVHRLSFIDPWFLAQIQDLVHEEQLLSALSLGELTKELMLRLKRKGFSDKRLADLLQSSEIEIRNKREAFGLRPVYKRIDSCAAEFPTTTAYMYSTYAEECESEPTAKEKIVVLGGGPNRIGQGIEFDYCCVHAALALREQGYETIMLNCNPETVSTDYDISDRLYFEPLTLENVLEVIHIEQPKGVIVQYGGQTPLNLARDLEAAGVNIIGTSPDAIDRAEDRERFQAMLKKIGLRQPSNAIVKSIEQAQSVAKHLRYPLVVRPSYVLGGRAMEIVYDEKELLNYLHDTVTVSNDSPVLLDHFLDQAIEVDVDAVCDGERVMIGGILEHIEQAGVHSGDSSCSLPPFSLSENIQNKLREQMTKMALELGVVGLVNAQFAIQDKELYVLELNPRASRTVPFLSKATGRPLAKIAARCMIGQDLLSQSIIKEIKIPFYAVKKAVFPFSRFPDADPLLGPEMKSTGEVMGIGATFAEGFSRSMLASDSLISKIGCAFLSVRDTDKKEAIQTAHELIAAGFEIVSTRGTATVLQNAGVICRIVNKVSEGRPHIVDMIKSDEIDYIVNTTEGRQAIIDSFDIRRSALRHRVRYTTTIAEARASLLALRHDNRERVSCLQELLEER